MSHIRTAFKDTGIQSALTQSAPEDGIVHCRNLGLNITLLTIEPVATFGLARVGGVGIKPLVSSQLDAPVLVATCKRKVYT